MPEKEDDNEVLFLRFYSHILETSNFFTQFRTLGTKQ